MNMWRGHSDKVPYGKEEGSRYVCDSLELPYRDGRTEAGTGIGTGT